MADRPTLQFSPDAYRTILDTILDGVYVVDRDRRILLWNRGAERISGYRADEVIGRRCADNILNHVDGAGTTLCRHDCPLAFAMADGQPRTADIYLHHKEGQRVSVEVKVSPLHDEAGRVIGAVEVFSDNSDKITALERVEHLVEESLIDPLTKVGNRRYIEITLRSRFEEMKRYGWPFAVALCDIDHFKQVNDAYGHAGGDAVLLMVSKTLRSTLRSFDFVGRWGGEEFLVCLPNVGTVDALRAIVERFRALVAASATDIDSRSVMVTASFGATIATPEDTMENLFKRADALLYRSKAAGRNRVTVG